MNHNGKLVSIGNILWRVLRHPLALDLTYEQASEYALEFLRLIGAPLSFLDVVTKPALELSQYKVALPSNILNIKGVKYVNNKDCSYDEGIAMRYATNTFHLDTSNRDVENRDCNGEFTYIIQDCILTASMKDGFISVSYKAIATDEYGYPMIPDNESYKMGLEYYILHRHIEPLWSMGKIQDKVFQYYGQQRDWYLAQASTSLMIANMDHLESAMNGLNRILIQTNSHETFFRNYGKKERIKKYH